MGLYDVVKPCVVGSLHYVRPTTQPIEVDDEVAGPLVDEGCLEPYRTGRPVEVTISDSREVEDQAGEEIAAEFDDEPPTDPPPPRARGGRRKD